MSFKTCTIQELNHHFEGLQKRPGGLILDVRSAEEFAEGHIPGSRNIDHEEVHEHLEELKKFERIYIYCRSGRRAQYVSELMEAKGGFKDVVCVASGGMEDWILAGFPVQT